MHYKIGDTMNTKVVKFGVVGLDRGADVAANGIGMEGAAMLLCLGAEKFTFAAFIAGAFTNALPGIIVQIVLVPMLVMILDKKH